MARKKRRKRWSARKGKTSFCRTLKASACGVTIGGRKYKARGRNCPAGKVVVCPHKRGRKTVYRVSRPGKKAITLFKPARRRRRR